MRKSVFGQLVLRRVLHVPQPFLSGSPDRRTQGEGEEFDCAVFLDQLDAVKYWVRNLASRPDSSFWLQTSTDKFYPDFVALLTDGRILVVECKGEHLWSNDDSKEKRAVGEPLGRPEQREMCLHHAEGPRMGGHSGNGKQVISPGKVRLRKSA